MRKTDFHNDCWYLPLQIVVHCVTVVPVSVSLVAPYCSVAVEGDLKWKQCLQ